MYAGRASGLGGASSASDLECRTGIFKNNSGCCGPSERVGTAGVGFMVGINSGGGREGWKLRIGGIGTGGVGSNLEDLRRRA